MSFALGLALLGGGLSVSLQAYLRAAARETGEALDRISLESAANETLGRIAAGEEHPVTPSTRPPLRLNGREVSVELSLPEGKRDLMDDSDEEVGEALESFGRPGLDLPPASARTSLPGFSAALRLSAAEEDCLRRLVTVGRAPEEFRPSAAPGAPHQARVAAAGDQVDLRLSTTGAAGPRILWLRARMTGQVSNPWALHDYRSLKIRAPGDDQCVTA